MTKKIISVLTALMLVLVCVPVAYAEEDVVADNSFTATLEGVTVEDRIFNEPVTVSGSFDRDGESVPSVEFTNCIFKQGISLVAGGDWKIFFGDNCIINGSIDKSDDRMPDFTEDSVELISLPTNTTVNLDGIFVGLYSNVSCAQYLFNGVEINGGTDGVWIHNERINYGDDENPFICERLVCAGATEIKITDGSRFDDYTLVAFDDTDCTVSLDIHESNRLGYFSLEGVRETDNDAFRTLPIEVTGTVENVDLLTAGMLDMSALAFHNGTDDTHHSCMFDMSRGNSVLSVGDFGGYLWGTVDNDTVINAAEGAVFIADNGINNRLHIMADGKELQVGGMHIFGNGQVYIPTADDSYSYELYDCDNNGIEFDREIIADENKTHLTVNDENLPENTDTYIIKITANGVTLFAKVYSKNLLIAGESNTKIRENTYEEPMIIRSSADSWNGITLENCTFKEPVRVEVSGEFLHISLENTVFEKGITVVGADGADTGVFLEQVADGTVITNENTNVNVAIDIAGGSFILDGVIITNGTAGEGEDARGNADSHIECWGEHNEDYDGNHSECDPAQRVRVVGVGDRIISATVTDTSPVEKINVNGTYGNVTVNLPADVSYRRDCMFRVSKYTDDNNEEREFPFNENAVVIVKGEVTNGSVEVCGNSDVSELRVTGTEERIMLGTWNGNSDYTIGTNTVYVCGDEPAYIKINARDGAVVVQECDWAVVDINDGTICLNGIHIFGKNEDGYAVYIPVADNETDYTLYINGEKVSSYVSVNEKENYSNVIPEEKNGDIGDWRLEAEKDGITLAVRILHKEWMCAHDNMTEKDIVPTCIEPGLHIVYCPDCEYGEVYVTHIGDGKHHPVTDTAIPATTTASGLTEGSHCEVCGAILKAQEIIPMLQTGETFTDSAYAKLYIIIRPGCTVEQLLQQAGKGAVVKDLNGKEMSAQQTPGTGMTLVMASGKAITLLMNGDANADGQVTAADARFALRASVKLETPTACQSDACNVVDTATSGITAADARFILRASVKLETL